MIRCIRCPRAVHRPVVGRGPAGHLLPRTAPFAGHGGWRAIALLEAGKGALALALVALGAAWHRIPSAAPWLARQLQHSPAFVPASLTALGSAYALLRFVEAYGLWHRRGWAALLGVASCLGYLPLEAWELHAHPGWVPAGALAITVLVLLVLAGVLDRRPGP